MPVHNEEIARTFDELADLLEVDAANPFRVRAYRNAALTIRALPRELNDMVAAGEKLTELPGIGKELAAKVIELLTTGHTQSLERLHRSLPASLEQLLALPGLGPKKVRLLHQQLGIDNLDQLKTALAHGQVTALPGFGPLTEQRLRQALTAQPTVPPRFLLATARGYAEPLCAWLRQAPGVEQVVVAGSYRRGRETVGDLDILVVAADGRRAIGRLLDYDEVAAVRAQGTTRATVVLRCGLQVDLRVVARASFGAALHYFTGSKAHNIAVRRLGQQRGLKVNEYGVYRGDRRIAGADETSVYAAVDLAYCPPELREGRGEIAAAQQGRLPTLVELADLRGDLHVHTDMSDGHADLRTMALAAKAQGLRYLAITDHSRRRGTGLDERALRQQLEQIDQLNEELRGVTLLKGMEVDILADGSLDLADALLAELDVVVGAVHSHFDLDAKRQTTRILRAMDHRRFTLLAHPSGRLLNERPPYAVEMERIIHHAAQRGCFLELDAQPRRLDLDDVHCQLAKSEGVLVSIDSDAHRPEDFAGLAYGVQQARRGWLERRDVLNTRPLAELRRLLQKVHG